MSELASTATAPPAVPAHAEDRRRAGFGALLAAERIKLVSTRSPWWCGALAIVLVIGMTAVIAATAGSEAGPMPFALTRVFVQFGMVIVMVLAAVAVTTEYRFSTIRTTFQAVPHRTAAMLAKTMVVGLVAALIGLVASFGAWGIAWLIRPNDGLGLATAVEWRSVAGAALVYLLAAVLAISVGILVRQTAGAVSLLLVWALLAENLVALIPNVGDDIQRWLPFINANHFLTDGLPGSEQAGPPAVASGMPFGPWGSLVYVAVVAAVLLTVSLVVNRRDA